MLPLPPEIALVLNVLTTEVVPLLPRVNELPPELRVLNVLLAEALARVLALPIEVVLELPPGVLACVLNALSPELHELNMLQPEALVLVLLARRSRSCSRCRTRSRSC